MRKRTRRILLSIFVLLPLLVLVVGGVYFYLTYQSIDLDRQLEVPSQIYDRDKNSIGRFSSEFRQVVDLDQISPYLLDAIIAIEDDRFYQHYGLDPRGIARALWRNIRQRRIVEGGSTITQQLAENEYFLGVTGPARTLDKKLQEAVYAVKLERNYTKEEILARYLNRIYFGHGRFGVEEASQYYFGTSAADLNLSEAALLAGMPRGPNLYSPRDNPELAHQRRDVVLRRMEELGYIDSQQRQQAEEQELVAVEHPERAVRANHFRIRVEDEAQSILVDALDVSEQEALNIIYNHGLEIETTLSLPAQQAAEQVMQQHGQRLQQQEDPNIQGVLVALDPQNGGIMALVESIELTGRYQRATEGTYDMGSSFKAPLYTAALQQGYSAASPILCSETAIDAPGRDQPYTPLDFGRTFHNRELRLREALEVSCNVVAVKVADAIGRDKFIEMVDTLNPNMTRKIGDVYNISLPLMPQSSPMDLTLTYAPYANGGYWVNPYTITEIRDSNGDVIYSGPDTLTGRQAIDPRLAYITTDMMRGVQGIADMQLPVAGKTGTAGRDSNVESTTFVGFTTEMVASVFFGFDRPAESTDIGNAVTVAVPAWRDFISQVYQHRQPADFTRPPGVEEEVICSISGQLATYSCPETLTELFMPGTKPTHPCPLHGRANIEICTSTGLPVTPYCPQHLRTSVPWQSWMNDRQCWLHSQPQIWPPDNLDEQNEELEDGDEEENDEGLEDGNEDEEDENGEQPDDLPVEEEELPQP